MNKNLEDFLKELLSFFPSKNEEYTAIIRDCGEVLATIIIEDVFMPEIIELLNKNEDQALLQNLFDFFEKVSHCNDENLINIFSITVLEVLGNDKEILNTAKKYMGKKTTQLQFEADRALGRV